MDATYERLAELIDDAERAYQLARTEVFDHLTLAAMIDPSQLTPRQQAALDRLTIAEGAVSVYRAELHDEAVVASR